MGTFPTFTGFCELHSKRNPVNVGNVPTFYGSLGKEA